MINASLPNPAFNSPTPERDGGPTSQAAGEPRTKRPLVRLGFLGLGWIGLNRLESLAGCDDVEIAAIADPSAAACQAARQVSPNAVQVHGLESLLAEPLDGIIIATPSGQHGEQVHAALRSRTPVFCQKPLTRTGLETQRLIDQAQTNNLLLAVDYCYRHVKGVNQLRQMVQSGQLGSLLAIDLVFHNAYAPNKSWALDADQSGGGCMIDLATHLIDLMLWITGDPPVDQVTSRLFRSGEPLDRPTDQIEDAGFAEWLHNDRAHVRLACSWNASIGCDAEIRAAFHGSDGSAVFHNVDGSFYDFAVEHHQGTARRQLAEPPDDWGGRAVRQWVDQLQIDPSFDPDVQRCLQVASIIDSIYGR